MSEIYNRFCEGLLATGWMEAIAVVSGIVSVWFSRKENILVYPTGLINTILYTIISVNAQLFGEATVNLYYTIMSLYGWHQWSRRNETMHKVIQISFSDKCWIKNQLLFFFSVLIIQFLTLNFIKTGFAKDVIPWADAVASASAFTAMWLMTRKKVESWLWWIITNFFSIPLYFVKGYVFTGVYYFVLLILAIMGLISWNKKAKTNLQKI